MSATKHSTKRNANGAPHREEGWQLKVFRDISDPVPEIVHARVRFAVEHVGVLRRGNRCDNGVLSEIPSTPETLATYPFTLTGKVDVIETTLSHKRLGLLIRQEIRVAHLVIEPNFMTRDNRNVLLVTCVDE